MALKVARALTSFTLLPPPPNCCQSCACPHEPEDPHNWQGLYWHTWFHNTHGRSPKVLDAFAHCSQETTDKWIEEMKRAALHAPYPEQRDAYRHALRQMEAN